MDLKLIVDGYQTTGQLMPDDIATLAAQGVKTLICNRPDMENPPALQASVFQDLAEQHGIEFVFNPFNGQTLSLAHVEEQADAIAGSDGPVVAYCASGNRSTVVWALGVAGDRSVDELIAIGNGAGHPFDGLRPMFEAAAARNTE